MEAAKLAGNAVHHQINESLEFGVIWNSSPEFGRRSPKLKEPLEQAPASNQGKHNNQTTTIQRETAL
ncbi:hypothetical protein K1719_004246 [Acacia pycnantha]|nr:hypothetical protein K1719_004246 [Acacia pycnantha]